VSVDGFSRVTTATASTSAAAVALASVRMPSGAARSLTTVTPGMARAAPTGSCVRKEIDVSVCSRSSAKVPVRTTRPRRTMLTRSQSASTSPRMWLDSRTVRPCAVASRMHAWNCDSINGSSPEVGSSKMSNSASVANAAMSATFCRLPLE